MNPFWGLITLVCLGYASGDNVRENVDDCSKAYTLGYGYETFYHISESGVNHDENQLTFQFYVKATSDAHVLLSPVESPTVNDPVYEVVLGAGRNSFSAIRRKLQKYSQSHTTTQDVLSGEEFRGFWIRIARSGLIEVGKEGGDVPFLFWKDPRPLVVHYFSFCNWASVIGQWAYNCPNETQAEMVDANLTASERLRRDLLTHYDPYLRPVINTSDPTIVYLYIQTQSVKLDEKHSVMSVIADVIMHWQDQKLQWDPEKYENISKMYITFFEVWQPELFLYNAVGPATGFLVGTPTAISSLGSITWKTQMSIEVRCNLELSQWPYDTHRCGIKIGFWGHQHNLILEYDNEIIEHTTNSEWAMVDLEATSESIRTPWLNDSDIPDDQVLAIMYTLQRSSYAYKAIFDVPSLAIAIMTLLPFWISPMNEKKLLVSCMSLTLTTVFVICLARILPAPANHVPKLVTVYTRTMLQIAFSIVISTFVIHIARLTHESPLPYWVENIVNAKFLHFILLLPKTRNQVLKKYENVWTNNIDYTESDTNSHMPENCEIQMQWIMLAEVIDRISFLAYAAYFLSVLIEIGILTWLSLTKKEEPESELITTMKRGILALQRKEHKKSEQMLHIALKLAQEQQNADAITYIYDLLANVAFEAGEHAKAEKLFVTVMQRLLTTGTSENDNKIIHISLKMATMYKEGGETRKAEEGYKFCIHHLEKKVERADDDDTLLLWAITVYQYARLLLEEEKYKEAITYFEKAYSTSVRVNGLVHEQNVILLNDIGSVYCLQNNYDKAIEYLKRAVCIGKQLPNMEDLASIYINLGTVYLKKMMLEEAQEACREGWKKAKSVENKEALDEANICLDELKGKLHL